MRTNKSCSIPCFCFFYSPTEDIQKVFFFIFLLVVQIIFTNKVFLPSSYIFSSNFELYIFVRLVLRTYHSFARLLPYWLREGAGGGVGFPRDSSSFRFSLSLSPFSYRGRGNLELEAVTAKRNENTFFFLFLNILISLTHTLHVLDITHSYNDVWLDCWLNIYSRLKSLLTYHAVKENEASDDYKTTSILLLWN